MNKLLGLLAHLPKKAAAAAVSVAALVLLLLYLQGTIGGGKVPPGRVPLPAVGGGVSGTEIRVERVEIVDVVDWPGTVTSRKVANVAPKVMARVVEMRVSVGSKVATGDVVAVLDDRDIRSRAEQARAALAAADAQAAQAGADERRTRSLFQKQAATQQDLEAVEARANATRAQASQARDALTEAQVMLGEATVRSPFAGVVAEKLADPGDMAVPGKPIAVVYDAGYVRLEAHVSERCAAAIAVGAELTVRIDAVAGELAARVDEVAPVVDPRSRTLLIKAALQDREPPLRPGTFGTLRAPCGKHQGLLVPVAAVTRTGQLETIRVRADGQVRPRHVRTGKISGDSVEILSGLREGEVVVVAPAANRGAGAAER